jgi:hypothetical protein
MTRGSAPPPTYPQRRGSAGLMISGLLDIRRAPPSAHPFLPKLIRGRRSAIRGQMGLSLRAEPSWA